MADALEFKGAAELRRSLKSIEKRFLREMTKAFETEADTVMALGKSTAPKDSGDLVAGTDVRVVRRRDGIEGAASFTRDRAAAVHEGVHWGRKVKDTRGFHWFGDAAADWEPKAVQRIVERLRAIANEKGARAAAPRRKRKPRPTAVAKAFKRARKTTTRAAKRAMTSSRKLAKRARKAIRRW